jgi:hypothetical protein
MGGEFSGGGYHGSHTLFACVVAASCCSQHAPAALTPAASQDVCADLFPPPPPTLTHPPLPPPPSGFARLTPQCGSSGRFSDVRGPEPCRWCGHGNPERPRPRHRWYSGHRTAGPIAHTGWWQCGHWARWRAIAPSHRGSRGHRVRAESRLFVCFRRPLPLQLCSNGCLRGVGGWRLPVGVLEGWDFHHGRVWPCG